MEGESWGEAKIVDERGHNFGVVFYPKSVKDQSEEKEGNSTKWHKCLAPLGDIGVVNHWSCVCHLDIVSGVGEEVFLSKRKLFRVPLALLEEVWRMFRGCLAPSYDGYPTLKEVSVGCSSGRDHRLRVFPGLSSFSLSI